MSRDGVIPGRGAFPPQELGQENDSPCLIRDPGLSLCDPRDDTFIDRRLTKAKQGIKIPAKRYQMFQKQTRFADMGKVKRTTNNIIDDALNKQTSFTRHGFHTRTRVAAAAQPTPLAHDENADTVTDTDTNVHWARAYWFPILCAIAIVLLIIWALFGNGCTRTPNVPEPTKNIITAAPANTAPVVTAPIPSFDMVRIEKDGHLVISGRYPGARSVSVIINKRIVTTERLNRDYEFVYAPKRAFAPGNYVIALVSTDGKTHSEQNVFVYVSEAGAENSMSLLMTPGTSTLLQSPVLVDGDLAVSKIDYLSNGRIVVEGTAIPRLRVTMSLDGKELGFARVSDHRNFGFGADVAPLTPGQDYKMNISLHDAAGNVVATVDHDFKMPEITHDGDAFYTVRRDDCLWFIARNYYGRGILYSMIVTRNHIKNPDLIFPKQVLSIPLEK